MSKRETVEEFLARGGTITKLPAQQVPEEEAKVTSTKSGGAQMLSLSDGGLYYAEGKAKKAPKKKPFNSIDFSALPPHLLKFLPNRED